MRRAVYITLITGLAACPKGGEPDAAVLVSDAAVLDAGAVAELAVDAGSPQPAELRLVVTATGADGGFEVVDGQVEPVRQLGIWIPVALADYRLRVFDDGDRIVPSDDTAHEADGGIDYQVMFLEPLRSGRSYRLTVESQLGQQLEGFRDAEVLFKVRGEIEREPKKAGGKKKKR